MLEAVVGQVEKKLMKAITKEEEYIIVLKMQNIAIFLK
jgi:hypothetical protein